MLDLDSLNNAQREAVTHGSGALLVLAGPGSGKTYTITQRIFYLLERENIKPENILVLTFTRDAAFSMQNRFQQASRQILPVNFGTFHSVFYHILRESHILNSNQLLTDARKKRLILPIMKQYLPKEAQSGQDKLSDDAIGMLAAISYFKNTGIAAEAANKLPTEWQPYFQTVLEQYEAARRRIRACDFDDMVYECHKALSESKDIRAYWQGRFQHILMDEFQDISPMQYEVIRLLAAPAANLFAVGDDDQSVYGFRGAKPACLKRFAQDYQAKQLCLNLNYRSRPEIIHASLSVINENKDRFFKELKPSPKQETLTYRKEETVMIRAFEEREQQYCYLAARLKDNASGEQTGVLFRTNSYMQSFAARLNREGIAYTMKEKTRSIYEHFAIKDIMAYIRLASGQRDRGAFLQIMNKPSRYISREALGLSEELPDYREICGYYRQKELTSRTIEVIHRIEAWEKQMAHLKKLPPFLAVQYIRRVIGYDTYLKERAGGRKEQWQEWEELLNWLGTDAACYETADEWITAQEEYAKALEQGGNAAQRGNAAQGRDLPADTEQSQTIALMTVHASKGLEFDRVYIPDCNEKIFPHGNMPDSEACEEERRIFYVAMTRARKSLELLYLTGTKERPRLPSRFLNKLLTDYSSTSSSNSQLSRYSSKASATFSYSSSSSMKSSSGSSLGSSGFS